jgi:Zn-dependent M28 family amino/carboxypeptidase
LINRIRFSISLISILATCTIFQKLYGQDALIDSLINAPGLQEIVQVLSSDSLQGRLTGTVHAHKAAVFIANEFKKAGAQPVSGYDGYLVPFSAITAPNSMGLNVISAIQGRSKPEELVIFCAHYDHIGTTSLNVSFRKKTDRKRDNIFNGANDNASGVSAVLSLARYFGRIRNNERTLVFIAFSGEELGLVGSRALALELDAERVKAVINIEMIGRGSTKKNKSAFITGSLLSDFQKLLNQKLSDLSPELYGKKYFRNDPFPAERLFYRSDNYWFARKGIPSHTIMASSPFDKHYHSLSDEMSTLDFQFMAEVVKAIGLSCTGLIDGSETPNRINVSNLEDL